MSRDWIEQYNRERFTRWHAALLIVAAVMFGVGGFVFFTGEAHPPEPGAAPRVARAGSEKTQSAPDETRPAPVVADAQAFAPPTSAPSRTTPQSAPASQPAARVTWPNSDAWLHFSSGSTPQPLKWSSPRADAILAPPITWAAQATRDEGGQNGQERLVRFIREHRANAKIGRYFSCCTVRATPQLWPLETLPLEAFYEHLLASPWSPQEPNRRYIDIRLPEVRQLAARLLVSNARRDDFLALDNFIFDFGGNPEGTTKPEWSEANYALLAEIYGEARRNAVPVVINASTRPEETWSRVTRFCDGILFEMPFHPNVRKAPAELDRELAAYRAALDAGKFVGLIPLAGANQSTAQRTEQDRMVAAGAMLIREPGDALFVSQTHYQPMPMDWMEWPAQLGRALGKYRHEATVYSRDFERASLSVEWVSGRVTVTPRGSAAPYAPAGK